MSSWMYGTLKQMNQFHNCVFSKNNIFKFFIVEIFEVQQILFFKAQLFSKVFPPKDTQNKTPKHEIRFSKCGFRCSFRRTSSSSCFLQRFSPLVTKQNKKRSRILLRRVSRSTSSLRRSQQSNHNFSTFDRRNKSQRRETKYK